MLEFYFSYRGALKRLRSGALADEMDRIAGDLHSQGYKPASAKLYLSRIARFSQFAAERCGSEPISVTTSVDTSAGSVPVLRGSAQRLRFNTLGEWRLTVSWRRWPASSTIQMLRYRARSPTI